MPTSRIIAHTSLHTLVPVFDKIRADAGVRTTYDDGVVAAALGAHREDDLPHIVGSRVDLTAVEFVTIDPEGSRDLDQAVCIERDGQGWRVQYAIADVGAHVVPGSALDADTHDRVETVYCPDMRVGLHPPQMSEGFASLLPGQRTKAVVWTLTVEPHGTLSEIDVTRAWVRSRHQYSYAQLSSTPPSDTLELVALMAEVGQARRRLLRTRGAVSLPKPSQEVVVEGTRVSLEFRAATGLEEDNAQISLMTGMAAAHLMLEAGVGVLRTMPPASDEALARLRRQAAALGIDWPAQRSYAELLDHLDLDSPRGAAFLGAAISLFRGARWEAFHDHANPPMERPTELTHGALAAPYAHVTAPLRRLVDRYATEICLAHRLGEPIPTWALDALPGIGATMMTGVSKGSAVDRACIDAVEVAMLESRVGEQWQGIALDKRSVQIDDPAVIAKSDVDVIPGQHVTVTLAAASHSEGALFTVEA